MKQEFRKAHRFAVQLPCKFCSNEVNSDGVVYAGYRTFKRGGAGYDRIGWSSLGFRAPMWAGIHPRSTRYAHETESVYPFVRANTLSMFTWSLLSSQGYFIATARTCR
jgi:hypothetical protein